MSNYGFGVTGPAGLAHPMPPGTVGIAAAPVNRGLGRGVRGFIRRVCGAVLLCVCTAVAASLLTWSVADPSLTHAASGGVRNWAGPVGAVISDLLVQMLGLASVVAVLPPAYWAVGLATQGHLPLAKRKMLFAPVAALALAMATSSLPLLTAWPLRHGYGGMLGDLAYHRLAGVLALVNAARGGMAAGLFGLAAGLFCLQRSFGLTRADLVALFQLKLTGGGAPAVAAVPQAVAMAASQAPGQPQWAMQPSQQHPGPQAYLYVPHPVAQHPQGFAQAPAYTAPAAAAMAYLPPASALSHAPGPQAPLPGPTAPNQELPWPIQRPDMKLELEPQSLQPAPHRHASPEPQPAHAAPAGAPRQAWLRPFPHRQAVPTATAPSPAAHAVAEDRESIAATRRRHVPGFDRETVQQSRSMAERFAPQGSGGASMDQDLELEGAFDPETEVSQASRTKGSIGPPEPAHIPVAAAERTAAREPSIFAPHTLAPIPAAFAGPTVSITPGGFYDRLAGGAARRDQHAAAGTLPPLALLKRFAAPAPDPALGVAQLRERSQLLLETLADFGVKGEITAVRPGPVVTLFEFEPARGTKSSRVIGLADDIARSMSARAVRIAVVPGVNAIGIELPNAVREAVSLRELLETDQFRKSTAKLPLALGRGIGGEAVIADLARMPHLLVAGTTGAGKSVGVNAMILSLLYQLTPEQCRLILIDPKMLELSVYADIPHLLTPVVTDPNQAVAALNWAVGEMERRYKRMTALSVRSIEAYNTRLRDTGNDVPMPHIVIVVDEFADLMAVAGKEIEFAVQRLAQMARAAGLHLIMATQRPSVDIITGTIKANFPTRISFRVTSRIDSRTILNEPGAEQLLGQGDMLYAGGTGQVVRVHGPFVSDGEVEAIANHLRESGVPDYVSGITDVPEPEATSKSAVVDEDELYDRAVALVRAERKASVSYLQRKLGIGYNRAATIMDRMQDDGLVGAANSAGKRELLPADAGDAGA